MPPDSLPVSPLRNSCCASLVFSDACNAPEWTISPFSARARLTPRSRRERFPQARRASAGQHIVVDSAAILFVEDFHAALSPRILPAFGGCCRSAGFAARPGGKTLCAGGAAIAPARPLRDRSRSLLGAAAAAVASRRGPHQSELRLGGLHTAAGAAGHDRSHSVCGRIPRSGAPLVRLRGEHPPSRSARGPGSLSPLQAG